MATPCAACGSPLPEHASLRGFDRLHRTPGSFEVAICRECGSGRTLPLVGEEALAAFYPEGYTAHVRPPTPLSGFLATALARLRYHRALGRAPLGALRRLPAGRLLDVGSGRGDLGDALTRKGWRVTGVEPSERASAEARSRGLDVEGGTIADVTDRLEPGFDAVVFQHSLEHVSEPLDDLMLVHRLLREGGLLLVSVPNFDSWQRRRFGSAWLHLDLPRHRSHFSARGLELLVRRAGFEVASVHTSTHPDGLPMSVQYRVLGRRRLEHGALLYASVGLSLVLVPLSAALNAIAGGGDVLDLVAVKGSGVETARR
jgi:SAM-dependent methyltransferase